MAISLVEANQQRAQLAAHYIVQRLDQPGEWSGFTKDEPLVGELRFEDFLAYHRKDHPRALIIFDKLQMYNVIKVDRGDPIVIERNVIERYQESVTIDKPVTYTGTLTYTFGETQTLSQQVKVGAEASVKVTAGVDMVAKVTAEVAVKIYAEYLRAWGESSTWSNTVERKITVNGPCVVDYEAYRAKSKIQRQIEAHTDFTHGIRLIDETGAQGETPPFVSEGWGWQEFLEVTQGRAPKYRETDYGRVETAMYGAFMARQLNDEQYEELKAPSDGLVSFLVNYDEVVEQDIKIL